MISGNVQLGGKKYRYLQWFPGKRLLSELISIDTETELIQPAQIPRLVVTQVFDGHQAHLIHPNDLGHFIREHDPCHFVGHNLGFDWPVIRSHLLKLEDFVAARIWLRAADQGRLADTMLLDQLVTIAKGGQHPRERDLAALATIWANIRDLDKVDPWRLRYGEIIGAPWDTVDPDAWAYAIKDAIATRLVYVRLRTVAERYLADYEIDPATMREHGRMSESLQIRASIALSSIQRNGLHVDLDKRREVEHRLRGHLSDCVVRLVSMPEFTEVFDRDKHGKLKFTPAGKPRVAQKRLREVLGDLAEQQGIEPPRSEKTGVLSLSRDFWAQHTDAIPFLTTWLDMEATAKLMQFFSKLQENEIHPRYVCLVRTGRTACASPNLQQMPKSGDFRSIFVPQRGYVFMTIDYCALELRTLAAVCQAEYGFSVLGDVIRAGTDPHAFTAATLMGITVDEFRNLPIYKQRRQAAKAVNFGVPGGLGPKSLAQYARLQYGVDMSTTDAEEFREKLLTDVYPELAKYLADDVAQVLADNLQCNVEYVERLFREPSLLRAAKSIVAGRTERRDGKPYSDKFIDQVWKRLRRLNRNNRLTEMLRHELAGEDLEQRLFFGEVMTTTGRLRGRTTFTQRRNTPFQAMAADGCKLALWALWRKGYRIVGFVHDEFLVELDEDSDLTAHAEKIDRICCESMQEMTGNVPVQCEYSLARSWSKDAEYVEDADGQIQVWNREAPL